MIIQKWFVILSILVLTIVTQGNALNSCSFQRVGNYSQPASYSDCTIDNPEPGTCCYVKVSMKDNTTDIVNTTSFCAFIPGSYVNDESVQYVKSNFNFPVEINCNSTFLSISFLIFIILSSLF